MEKSKKSSALVEKIKSIPKVVLILTWIILCVPAFIASYSFLWVPQHQEHTHEWSEWTVTQEATCIEDGQRVRSCECGESETESIAATGHNIGEWQVVKEANCTEDGQRVRSCACGEWEKEKMAALGHDMGAWNIVKTSTAHEEGEQQAVCNRCGVIAVEKFPLLEMKFIETPLVSGRFFLGEILNASVSPKGATVTYQWYRNDIPISGATSSSYQLMSKDVGYEINVMITGIGEYCGQKISDTDTIFVPLIVIDRADTTITIELEKGLEYSIGDRGWISSISSGNSQPYTFRSLRENTHYIIYVREKTDEGNGMMVSMQITTKKSSAYAVAPQPVSILEATDSSITIATVAGQEYRIKPDVWIMPTGSTYTWSNLKMSTKYIIETRTAGTIDTMPSSSLAKTITTK